MPDRCVILVLDCFEHNEKNKFLWQSTMLLLFIIPVSLGRQHKSHRIVFAHHHTPYPPLLNSSRAYPTRQIFSFTTPISPHQRTIDFRRELRSSPCRMTERQFRRASGRSKTAISCARLIWITLIFLLLERT